MGKKYFFKAPYKSGVYISLRVESKKFTTSKDGRFIVATEPLTLREYYAAFNAGTPFKAYVKDKVKLVVPYDLIRLKNVAIHACRGIRRMFLSWRTIETEDFNAAEEVEIRGNFVRSGVNEMLIRGYGEVETPYICEDPDDCMWPSTMLTVLHDIVYKYKEWQYMRDHPVYGGEWMVERIAELFSVDPRHTIFINDADVGEIERLLKERGFDVLKQCNKEKAMIRIEKAGDKLLIEC